MMMDIYRGKFVSRDNKTYIVSISKEVQFQVPFALDEENETRGRIDEDIIEKEFDKTDKTEEVHLWEDIKLGVPPFVVKYEGTEDFNKPLKFSNATIRIVTTSIPWDLVTQKPNEIMVKLTNQDTNEIVWVGFVDPKIYTMGANKNLEEFDVNCIDGLSTLQYKYYAMEEEVVVSPQIRSFYDIIKEGLNGLPYTTLYFPRLYKKNGEFIDLKSFFINENTFIDKDCFNINDDGTSTINYEKNDTYKDVFEKLMMYLNLTMLAVGNRIYCLPMDYLETERTFLYYVYNLSNDSVETTLIKSMQPLNKLYQPTSYSLTEQYNQVTVTAKMKEYGSLIPELFDDKYLLNTTNGVYRWNEEITEKVKDNQKGDKEVEDDCKWRFYKHKYYTTYYYNGTIPLISKTEMQTLDEMKTLTCGQIVKYGCAVDAKTNEFSMFFKDKYKDYPKENGLTNYVYLGTYDGANENTPLIGTNNMPQVLVFDNSYINLNYTILFRPPNGTPWHIPSSWEVYAEDEFYPWEAYIEMELSCLVDGKTYYYDNRDNQIALIFKSTWKPIGEWKVWNEGEQFAPRCRIPFQCLDNSAHLYGKEWKNIITSGIAGNEGTENGFIIKPPKEAIGKMARFNLKVFWRRMKSTESDHNTRATWLKELSIKMQIPKDESIRDWQADTEYTAKIADEYVNEGEKIEMAVNTFDHRVPSYSCVMIKNGDNYQLADLFAIHTNNEVPHRMEEWKIYHKVCQHKTPRKVLNTTIEGIPIPQRIYINQDTKYILNQWEVDYYDNKSQIELIEQWNLTTD